MPEENLHLHKSSVKQNFLVFVLFVPAVVFVLALGVYLKLNTQNLKAYSNQNDSSQPVLSKVATHEINIEDKSIMVELANTDKTRAQGLSGRQSLSPDQGMLFVFDKGSRPRFWMKDMHFAIDIIWIAEGKISQISRNLLPPEPGTKDSELALFIPNDPVDYVLEVAAGTASANLWQVGDEVTNLP